MKSYFVLIAFFQVALFGNLAAKNDFKDTDTVFFENVNYKGI